MPRRTRIAVKAGLWVVCLLPLGVLFYRYSAGTLGASPIPAVQQVLGGWALRLLLASLLLTPLRLVFGLSWPLCLRRLLGLFAFFYTALHFTAWLALDRAFNWQQILADILRRPSITIGMLALLLLVPLAITSTTGMVKRLGGRAWRRLHRLVYVVGVLGVLHSLWVAKNGMALPYLSAAVLALLLGVRVREAGRRLATGHPPRRPAPAPARIPWPAMGGVPAQSRGVPQLASGMAPRYVRSYGPLQASWERPNGRPFAPAGKGTRGI